MPPREVREIGGLDDLAPEAGDSRERGGEREDRGVDGDAPARRVGGAGSLGRCAGSLGSARRDAVSEVPVSVSIWARAGYSRARRGEGRGFFLLMANIKSQKKRILRAERERLENRRYTSKIKTFFRRLETAVADGDGAQADTEHRELVQAIDKAVKRGALHRNSGARKKSRAARVRRG